MNSDDRNHRTYLSMRNTARRGLITYDAKNPETKFPPIEQLRPPKGAPNVLLILINDAGFGSASAFGGPCQTPNAEKLAANGLKYNRFCITALCSPTRQAMLIGRNHHTGRRADDYKSQFRSSRSCRRKVFAKMVKMWQKNLPCTDCPRSPWVWGFWGCC